MRPPPVLTESAVATMPACGCGCNMVAWRYLGQPRFTDDGCVGSGRYCLVWRGFTAPPVGCARAVQPRVRGIVDDTTMLGSTGVILFVAVGAGGA